MGNNFSALHFAIKCQGFDIFFTMFFYAFSAVIAVTGLELMRQTQGWKNGPLLALLLCILAYSIVNSIYPFVYLNYGKGVAFLGAATIAGENACHWVITAIYLRVMTETRLLLHKDTYANIGAHLAYINRFRWLLNVAHVIAAILIFAFSAINYIGDWSRNKMLVSIGLDCSLVFQTACSLTWGCTLINLYRDVKQAKKLMPNQRIFLLHGCLLTLFLVLVFVQDVLLYV